MIEDRDMDVWNIRGLRKAGYFVADTDRPIKWDEDHDCLCGVDVLRVLSRSGHVFEYNPDDDSYYIPNVKKNPHKPTQDKEQSQERGE